MTISLPRKDAGAMATPRFGLARVTWRQQRATLLGLGGLAGALAAAMLAAGLRGHALYPAFARNHCLPVPVSGLTEVPTSPICRQLGGQFPGIGGPFYQSFGHTTVVLGNGFVDFYPDDLTLALLALFLLTGMFLGAPALAREYERGTFRFAWTQGTTPVRWCVTKLLLLGGAAMGAGAGLGALGAWSLQPFNLTAGASRWLDGQFETTVVTAAAWAGLAFALGAFSGTLFRRTVPAMAATAAGVGALLAATFWKLNALLLRGWHAGPHGQRLSRHHDTFVVSYQPAGRYWIFQGVEGGALLLLALLLGAATVWLVRSRGARTRGRRPGLA